MGNGGSIEDNLPIGWWGASSRNAAPVPVSLRFLPVISPRWRSRPASL